MFALLAVEVAAAGHREMSAWWMSNHQIPAITKHLLYRLLQVPLRIAFAWQQVTAPCVVAIAAKSITDAGAVFAGDEHPHSPCRLASRAW